MVWADVPPERKPERGHIRHPIFPRNDRTAPNGGLRCGSFGVLGAWDSGVRPKTLLRCLRSHQEKAWRVPTEHLSRRTESWPGRPRIRNVQIRNLAVLETKTGTRVRSHGPPERATGTRAHSPKTTLLRNHYPFVSSQQAKKCKKDKRFHFSRGHLYPPFSSLGNATASLAKSGMDTVNVQRVSKSIHAFLRTWHIPKTLFDEVACLGRSEHPDKGRKLVPRT